MQVGDHLQNLAVFPFIWIGFSNLGYESAVRLKSQGKVGL